VALLAADPRIDVLMHRFNMAHRKAAHEVFPAPAKAGTPNRRVHGDTLGHVA
jgi:hypothetical protein